MMHVIRVVFHGLSWSVRSRSFVVDLNKFQNSYARLIWGASEKRGLAFSKFHMSIETAGRAHV